MVLHIRARLLGAHVHATVYTGPRAGQLGRSGQLIFREDEYSDFVVGMRLKQVAGFEVIFEGYLVNEPDSAG